MTIIERAINMAIEHMERCKSAAKQFGEPLEQTRYYEWECILSSLRAQQEQNTYKFAPIDKYKGLKRKYVVLKADTGECVESCFVLRPDKDAAAVAALRTYARSTGNKTLAKDLINWVGAESDKVRHKQDSARNTPLTLDELRQMDGEPVWVVLDERKTPCDLCAYNPPSSLDGKPCSMCPATAKEAEEALGGGVQ